MGMVSSERRAFGYVRVSALKEGAVSPAMQREEVERYCQAKGWTIVGWFEDLDWSASKHPPLEMPGFSQMVQRAEDGEADVLVFYRADRAAREFGAEFQILRRYLQGLGVGTAFAGREYDNSPEGEFNLDLDMALGKLEARRLGKRVRDAHRALRKQGRWPGGPVPFGFIPRHPGLEPDPAEAVWVIRVFEWYCRGWALNHICRELNDHGVKTRTGRIWKPNAVKILLGQPAYAGGRLLDGQLVTGGNIVPLMSRELWERVQALRAARFQPRSNGGGRPAREAITGSMCRCGVCGGRLAVSYRRNNIPAVRCQHLRSGVPGVAIQMRLLEPVVLDVLIAHLEGVGVPYAPLESGEDLAPVKSELARVQTALVRLATAYARGDMGADEYAGARARLLEERKALEDRQRRAAQHIQDYAFVEGTQELFADLGQLTPAYLMAMDPEARREVYQAFIEAIVVHPFGHEPRVDVRFRTAHNGY